MARFIIATDGMSKPDKDSLTKWLHTQPWGFAHWLDPIWFLSGVPDAHTAKTVYDIISKVLPSGEPSGTVVLRVDPPMTHWGRANKALWEWLKKDWCDSG